MMSIERISEYELPTGKSVCFVLNENVIQQYMSRFNVNRARIVCFKCNEFGHYRSECEYWKTKLCKEKSCKYHSVNCIYAHNITELRPLEN